MADSSSLHGWKIGELLCRNEIPADIVRRWERSERGGRIGGIVPLEHCSLFFRVPVGAVDEQAARRMMMVIARPRDHVLCTLARVGFLFRKMALAKRSEITKREGIDCAGVVPIGQRDSSHSRKFLLGT